MIHLIPTQHEKNFARSPPAELIISRTRFCLGLLMSIPVALAKGVISLSEAIGSAARMAYVDPYMPNRKDRK